ncbi:MAG: geranyl transferase [Gammaproteobacteria bacterium]|jgi:geranylgeranyl pyrophosphate synthase|nr:geranyl transferase [Gammaproteobacteria bacterium]|tara:strand:+ start:2296 stop:3165 length:870 start_codon:yes stop_codon:yes gene_type:complete
MSEFEKLLESYQARVNQKLEVLLPDDDSILISAMRYSVLNGGKRLRPILAYLTGELNDTEAEYIDTLASSLELIHCYSLIHDDLPAMDDDELRRGNPTTHKKFDEATAILAGDALQPLAFELISTIKTSDRNKVQMISSLSEACGYLGMVGGQIKDINSNQIKDVESLDSMHSEKTGRLIQASIETAGILSGLSASDIESLKEYGGKIGLAFQIQDDIIDIESPASVSGKDQGSDIGKDKTTYPSLVGLEASKVRAQELSNDAKKILQPINKNTDNLDKLADYIVSRKA